MVMSTTLIIIIVLAIVVVWFIAGFNGLVTLRNRTREGWADIEVQLKRRYDLIPNLVSTVKGYAAHESTAFEKVSQARSQAMQASAPAEKSAAENTLSGTLKSLFAISEAYPDLKANTNFLELQRELSDTENKIQSARRFYNGMVRDLNTKIEHFPSNIIAGLFHFAKMDFFDLGDNDAAQNPVEVKF